ncbi:NADH:flavin oxidoreductase [Pleurocapsales cyanobacterium LEGE 06147]|nr:NADH:flavin oxidoreductase [Pleurocapsales cyanobacterium LEGE 06147]
MNFPQESSNCVANFPHLFSPLQLGQLELENRIVVAPMTRVSATEKGIATQQMADYYAEFTRGGFGLVETEGTYVDEAYSQGYANQPGIANETQANAWRRVVRAVHAQGSPIFIQLMHAGALVQANRFCNEALAPSAVQPRGEQLPVYGGSGKYFMPRQIARAEIRQVIASFTAAAARAVEAGFDGIEVHAANGYLLDQFLTDYTNHRTDEYGGSIQNRIRFAVEVLQAVRDVVGPNYPVGIRISQNKVNDYEYQWSRGESDAAIIFGSLAAAGATFIHIAGYDACASAFSTGPALAALAKQYGRVPVIANGQLEDPQKAESLLKAKVADLISLVKGALANPNWPRKTARREALEAFDFRMLQPRATLSNAEKWRKRQQHST